MAPRKSGFIQPAEIDALMSRTSPAEVAAFYKVDWPSQKASGEARVPCYFTPDCRKSNYGQLTVNLDSPQSLIYCHSCGIRGNLLALMWGMKHNAAFDGDKLRGQQFKEIVTDLQAICGGTVPSPAGSSASPPPYPVTGAPPEDEPPNVPLKDSPNERARKLVNLDDQFVTDVGKMNELASAYVRSRPFLTPEVMAQWRIGYLRQSSKSLYRGHFMYPLLDENGEVLTWFGRDMHYDAKLLKWTQAGCNPDDKPPKTRFVKGFSRGRELFGQHGRQRLRNNPALREGLARMGLFVCEGQNDVIRLDSLGAPAVGVMSNTATDLQIEKIIRFARQAAGGRIILMPDNDADGERGFKETLWKLASVAGIDVRLGWSSDAFSGRFAGRQPESLSSEEWEFLAPTLQWRDT